jgi:hypothetical protein
MLEYVRLVNILNSLFWILLSFFLMYFAYSTVF